jgi:TRAP-type C4-dicarboxylate transport system permease small subunit
MAGGTEGRVGLLFNRILDFGMIVGSVSIFFLVIIVCYDVIMRYFFNAPTIWVAEVCGILLLFLPFLAGGWLMRKDGHVKMDLVLDRVGPKTRVLFTVIAYSITALTCAALLVYGVKISWGIYEMGYKTDTLLRLTKWPLLSMIPLGFFLLFVQSLRKIFNVLIRRHSPDV